ncbi:MAG: ribose-5-phosphate isomerase RpiA [Verrucomicrobia bacterium]|nr:ribose-5-phosphate isomerase RpiA [Verrucomicrobiota bacterium]
MRHDNGKEIAGLKALEFVKDGMLLGLGTGSTAAHFIKHLIKRCQNGLKIQAVATSLDSERLAREGGIEMIDINTISSLDLVVDGADQIDPNKRLIKGAGGALMREKIVATMSKMMVVIADESKLVEKLGLCALPIEVLPFGVDAIRKQLADRSYRGTWRKKSDGSYYLTDNHNRIFDISLPSQLDDPESVHEEIRQIPGVLETGFFFNLATHIVIGKTDGTAVVKT